jgi:NhaP-type Na+/H+ or K+/H+ antiporter
MSVVPSPSNTTILPNDEIISVQAFGDVLKLYAGILSLCSLVALINYHRLKFPLPISLSLSGLVMSIILVAIDAVIQNHPIRVYVQGLLLASDFDEVILRFGVGFIMFASAMESDLSSLRPKWGLIFLLSVCGVIISITLCASASLAIFIGFNYYSLPLSVIHILTPVLFGCVVAPTDAHHFVLEALQKNGAPESFSAIVVGEGLTNDALAVVAFSIVKTLVDSEYVRDEGGCDHILTQEECVNFHMCEWDVPDTVGWGRGGGGGGGGGGGEPHRHHNLTTTATQVMSSLAGAVGSSENNHAHIEGSCVTGHMEIDVWSEIAKDVFGGIFVGVFLAWIFSSIMRRVRQPNINILLSITLVLDVIVVSDLLNSSPAVACAAAGLFLRAFGLKYIERRSLEELDIVWKFFEEALSGIFFLLIGLVIIIDNFNIKIFFASVIAIPVTLGARYCSVALPMWAWNFASIPADKIPWSIVPAMTWGGIRGGSSVALALSLSPVEGRSTIFAMTYAVVLHSLIVQGLSVPKFFKNLFRIEGDNNHNNTHADNGQFAWLAAEKDGILDDLKHGMDTSPLLRQMLAEQGIAREHLVSFVGYPLLCGLL